MKSKLTPAITLFAILVSSLLFGQEKQAALDAAFQIPTSEILQNSRAKSNPDNDFEYTSQAFGTAAQAIVPAQASPKIPAGGPIHKVAPVVVNPTAAQLGAADRQVDALVADLSGKSHHTLSITSFDEVALRYDRGSKLIVMTPASQKSRVLESISPAEMGEVLIIRGNDNDNHLELDNTILDLGIANTTNK